MKKLVLTVAVFMIFFGLSLINSAGTKTVNTEDVVIAQNDTAEDDVVAMGSSVVVKGTAKKNVVAFGGDVIVSGEVKGDAVTLGGDIILEPGADIGGDTVCFGGVLKKAPEAKIRGQTVSMAFGKESLKNFALSLPDNIFALLINPVIIGIRLSFLLVWFLVAILFVALFPQQIDRASLKFREGYMVPFLVGFVFWILLILFLIIFGVLSFILIGIPFLLVLIVVGAIVKLFGLTAVFSHIGERIADVFGREGDSPYVNILFGIIVLGLIKFIPLLGTLIWGIITCMAAGTAVLTRFGTKRKKQRNMSIS